VIYVVELDKKKGNRKAVGVEYYSIRNNRDYDEGRLFSFRKYVNYVQN